MCGSRVTEGRLPQIMDNLLTQGKAVPMVVVVPEAHALTLEPTPAPISARTSHLTW